VPWCFQPAAAGYALSGLSLKAEGGLTGLLTAIAPASSSLGADIVSLNLDISFDGADSLRVLITDASDAARWQIPASIVPTQSSVATNGSAATNLALEYTTSPFTFTVRRKADNSVLFASSPALVFKDQYLELATSLESDASLFGLGEVTRSAGLKILPGTTTTMWARDMPALAFDTNLYGSHPFFLALSPSGDAHGAFLRSSNGMDVLYASSADALTFKVIGGVLDLFVFNGPTPKAVAAQYTNLIGRPALMPYWSLGYHQCKYGYTTLQDVIDVRANFTAFNLPLDTLWLDIDYMASWKDWSYDPALFPQASVAAFVDDVHASGQKFVVIVDPGILNVDPSWSDLEYPAYTAGVEADLFVKDGFTGAPYVSQVWPGPTLMPDWLHPNASAYWTTSIATFWAAANFDGLWTDMNEVSNFCNDGGQGQVCANHDPAHCPTGVLATQTTCCLSCQLVDGADKYDFPPYSINNDNSHQALGHKTLPPSALHYRPGYEDASPGSGDADGWSLKEYDVHNLFGLLESKLTAEALTQVRGNQRPFVLSRSTFPSSGAHVAHWTGDNAATWADLKASIPTAMNMGLYGIPMVGSDICGFNGDTTEELCGRWMALGAFSPFSRNHNAIGQLPQEPYRWDSVANVSRQALNLRYRLLPYLYTLFYNAHASGSLVAQPLWATFPEDAHTHEIDEQFMLGDSLLVSPALYEGQTTVTAYFPNSADGSASAVWHSLSGAAAVVCASGEGSTAALATPVSTFNVHVQSGGVVPLHAAADAEGQPPLTTQAARALPYELLVALDPAAAATANGAVATGALFLDDGEQPLLAASLRVAYAAVYTLSGGGSVTATVVENGYAAARNVPLGAVTALGVAAAPVGAVVIVAGGGEVAVPVAWDETSQAARIDLSSVALAVNQAFVLTWL
jgi:alpha-glucosidase (family GH31 glycosyl hydrolase)